MDTSELVPESVAASAPAIFNRLLVPVDFSMISHEVVEVALALRGAFGSRLCLFNVTHTSETDDYLGGCGNTTTPGHLIGAGTGALQRFIEHVAPGHVDAFEYAVQVGDDSVRQIREQATRWGATLVLLSEASHRTLLRTHTEKLLHELDVAVLIVQPRQKH